MRVQEWELLDAATWSAGQYAGLSPHHTTLPPTQKHTVAAEGLLPDWALLSSTGGFTELSWIRTGPRAKREESVGPTRGARATRQDTTTMTLEAGYDFDVLNVSMIPRIAAATTRRRRAGTVVASRHTQV